MIQRALLVFGISAAAAVPAAAQVAGIPVVNNGTSTGINIGADIGFPNAEYGSGTAVGAHASIGIGFLGVTGMISRYTPSGGDAIVAPGVAATMRLLGGPLVPFRITLQAGASKWTEGNVSVTHVPISIGLSATIPNPAFAIKPWIAPRLDVMHTSGTSIEGESVSSTPTNFGISGGVDIALLSGVNIRGAYDRTTNGGAHPSIFSLGLGFSL